MLSSLQSAYSMLENNMISVENLQKYMGLQNEYTNTNTNTKTSSKIGNPEQEQEQKK